MNTRCAVLAIAIGLSGCDRSQLSGPPELRLGRDECAECGMLINEDRCSSAYLVERGGRRDHALFDDIGCMLDYAHEPPEDVRVIEGFVHDHPTRTWVPAPSAHFLMGPPPRLATPMGSGIWAFADRSQADAAQRDAGGTVLDLQGITSARRAWMEERYGKSAVPSNR